MNTKLTQLTERRATLVARAAAQRIELSQALEPWRGPLSVVDQVWGAVRFITDHPALLAGMVAFVATLRPWRMVGWLPKGWVIWRIARLALGAKRFLPGW